MCRLTLLPLIDKTVAALNNWLAPKFGSDLRLDVDRDAIPALSVEREALWNRIGIAPFLTPNEKRRMVGLDAIEGGDELSGTSGVVPPGPFDPGAAIQRKMAAEPKVKIWRTVGDGKVRDSHVAADGQVRLLDEPFDIGGIPLNAPRDPDGPPDETFNCRCLMEIKPVSELQGEDKDRFERYKKIQCDELLTDIQVQDQIQDLYREEIRRIGEEIADLLEKTTEDIEIQEPGAIGDALSFLISMIPILRGGMKLREAAVAIGELAKALVSAAGIHDEIREANEKLFEPRFQRIRDFDEKIAESKKEQLQLIKSRERLGCLPHFPIF